MNTIPFNEPSSIELLKHATSLEPLTTLAQHYQIQINLAYCGVATACCHLNASGLPKPDSESHKPFGYFNQESFFIPETQPIVAQSDVRQRGMSLAEYAKLSESHGLKYSTHFAAETSLEQFELDLQAFTQSKAFIALNYNRPDLDQNGGGHFSPIGCYIPQSSSPDQTGWVLVMDTASYRLPWIWVPTEMIYQAMIKAPGESAISRGWATTQR